MDTISTLSRNLKYLRESKGLTQQDASEGMAIPFSSYRAYEYAKRFPPPDVLDKISSFYEVKVSCLFNENLINETHSESVKREPGIKEKLQLISTELGIPTISEETHYYIAGQKRFLTRAEFNKIMEMDVLFFNYVPDESVGYDWEDVFPNHCEEDRTLWVHSISTISRDKYAYKRFMSIYKIIYGRPEFPMFTKPEWVKEYEADSSSQSRKSV